MYAVASRQTSSRRGSSSATTRSSASPSATPQKPLPRAKAVRITWALGPSSLRRRKPLYRLLVDEHVELTPSAITQQGEHKEYHRRRRRPADLATAPASGFRRQEVCIGGINASNTSRVMWQSKLPSKSLDGVAVVSAIMGAADPEASARELGQLVKAAPAFGRRRRVSAGPLPRGVAQAGRGE